MNVAVVAPSGSRVGMGHVARQLAFAARARARGHAVTILTDSDAGRARCRADGFACEPLPPLDGGRTDAIDRRLDELAPDRVVADLPDHAVADLAPWLDARGAVLVQSPAPPLAVAGAATVLVGHDLDVVTRRVVRTEGGRRVPVHSGRGYLLFRDEFAAEPPGVAARPADALLVTHGGSDPWHLTERTLAALQACRGAYRVTVLVGPAFGEDRELDTLAAASRHAVRLVPGHRVPGERAPVANAMRAAGLAIINGGSTRYELCMTGTPFLALAAHERQHRANASLARLGAGVAVGAADAVADGQLAAAVDAWMGDAPARAAMGSRMRGLFDMRGADRLLDVVRDPAAVPAEEAAP